MQELPLPHYNERKTPIDMLVLHATCHDNAQDVFASLNKLELSCHYFIDPQGNITRMVNDEHRAWHAGLGYWRGIDTDLNSHSIGIEIGNMSLGQKAFPAQQIQNLIPLCQEIIKKYKIKQHNVVAHSDIAPTRKPDPGKCFPWQELAKADIGLWYDIKNADLVEEDNPQELLKIIGYDTRDEEKAIASAYAFRRRFLPAEVAEDNDIQHLVDNVYPLGKKELLSGKRFLQTLKTVAYTYSKA